jgi:hypothetical protein
MQQAHHQIAAGATERIVELCPIELGLRERGRRQRVRRRTVVRCGRDVMLEFALASPAHRIREIVVEIAEEPDTRSN